MGGHCNPLITILGPTASGKTKFAVALAQVLDGEIISADSRQVFREMEIGTGKDLKEYGAVPHHLINIRNAGETYDVSAFQSDFHQALKSIHSREKQAILCGGSGMYIQAVLQDFKHMAIPRNEELRMALENLSIEELSVIFEHLPKKQAFKSDCKTRKRLIRAIEIAKGLEKDPLALNQRQKPVPHIIFGLNPAVNIRRERIRQRLKKRMEEGMVKEVEGLLQKGISPDKLLFYGLEYKWITLYLKGELTYSEMYEKLETAILQFAKRQMTYFRKMEKDGLKIHWIF